MKLNQIKHIAIVIFLITTGFFVWLKNIKINVVQENIPTHAPVKKSPAISSNTNVQKSILRSTYSFKAPQDWLVHEQINFDGCIWDGISIPTDGHEVKGEIGIYPKSCFDISKLNPSIFNEKDGYYITAIYDKDGQYAEIVRIVYSEVLSSFTLK